MSCAHDAAPVDGQCPACLPEPAARAEPELTPRTIVPARFRSTERCVSDRAGETGRFGGTPADMAPEQFETRRATPQSDVYALGLLLSEILGGEEEIIARCLRRDPAERPAVREVLATIARDAAPSPEYIAASEQAPRLSLRQAWALAAAASALLAMLIALYPRPHAMKPDVLARKARSLAGRSMDSAYWFDDALLFHYRSSPRPMLASRGRVTD